MPLFAAAALEACRLAERLRLVGCLFGSISLLSQKPNKNASCCTVLPETL
jgi:hypothetical protein